MIRSFLPFLALTLGLPTAALANTFEVQASATKNTFELRVVPAEGHHLAEDYPARLVLRTLPETALDDDFDLTGRVGELLTGITVPLPAARPLVVDGELDVGVCDVAGTCTPREVAFQLSIRRLKPVSQTSLELRMVKRIQTRKDVAADKAELRKVVERASLDGGLRAALNEAETRADPLLALFKTSWCPPCRRLQAEVLDNPEYAPLLDRFVVASFDADLPNSWEAKSRWHVGGYPTVLVCTFDGEVIWRQVGFEDATAFTEQLSALYDQLVEGQTPIPGEDATPGEALWMADLARHREDREQAAAWYARVPADASVDLRTRAEVRAYLARTEPDPATAAAALEAVLLDQALEPAVPLESQMWWWYRVARLEESAEDTEGAALAWQRGRAAAEQLLAGGALGLEAAAGHGFVALASEELGEPDAAKTAWSEAADDYLAALSAGSLPDMAQVQADPGLVLELADALLGAGRMEEAANLFNTAVDAHPDEATFYRLRAGAGADLGMDPDSSLADAATAYRLASGDNKLRAADLWSRMLVEAERPLVAAGVLHEALDKLVLPQDQDIRTHRYARSLRERLNELEPPAAPETP
ncbi:MAG: thioredoxin family protein [Myxococcota bacterium]|jgi:thiol-disulfide isomerase/thioredoxin|nr:thioredoxin family protein [Myxococcota bacterium]